MKKKSLRGIKSTALILLTCALVLNSLQTPKVEADVVVTITPTSGNVGTIIEINATIETENGFYVIRWDGALNVTTGYAIGKTVQTSFTVPHTAGALGGRDVLVELIDNTTKNTGTAIFKLYPKYYIKAITPQPPLQLQEGANTTLWINMTGGKANTPYAANVTVKDPADKIYFLLTTLNTNTTGYGETHVTYPEDFGSGAHTNYTGRYRVAFNETLATSEFSMGLTNATQYEIFQTVNILAANYTYPTEHAWVNITYNGENVFSQNVTASNGLIETNWKILQNASIGTYTVTITNSTTPGTHKPVEDTQNFTVKKPIFTVQISAKNLNNEALSNLLIEAHNETTKVEAKVTNATGVATFLLEMANYTFKGFMKDAAVGVLSNQSIMENKTLTLKCLLTNIKVLVVDQANTPMPFVSLTVNYSYTTRLNTTQETLTYTTNHTGIWELHSMFTNISYVIEAQRYGHIFNHTYIGNMSISPWFNLTIVLPTYTMLIHVVDSKANAVEGVKVEAYEWSKGTGQPEQSYTTNSDGNVTFSLTFGKYRIKAYKDDVFLNAITIDLIQNQSSFVFYLATFNVDLSVIVLDFFGQPIPNALVKVVKAEQDTAVKTVESTTGSDGRVSFNPLSISGGDLQISVYVKGQLGGTKYLYLTNSKEVTFRLNKYVVFAGYAMELSQFVTVVVLAVLIVIFIGALSYKRLLKVFKKSQ